MAKKKETTTNDKRLYKIKSGKLINGVCKGIAEYFNVDVTIIRIIFVVALFFQGAGAVVYLLAMIFLPEKPVDNQEEPDPSSSKQLPIWIGAGLIIGGLMMVVKPWRIVLFYPMHISWMYDWRYSSHHYFWPVIIILLGIGYLFYVLNHDKKDAQHSKQDYKWKRVEDGKIVSGVLGGLAKLWGHDASIVRIGFILLAWLTHPLIWILIYAVLSGLLPKENRE